MNNKVITVPKDYTAEKLLDTDNAKENQLIEYYLSPSEFKFCYEEGGIFMSFNRIANVIIDDYESDEITDIEKQREIVNFLKSKLVTEKKEKLLLLSLIRLFEEAINRNTGVYFFF